MSKKVMSVKGEMVDFDLLAVKNQISESPKTDDVVERERFIDKKRRRGGRKINQMLSEQAENKKYAENMIDAQRKTRDATPVSEPKVTKELKEDVDVVRSNGTTEKRTRTLR